MGYIGNQTTNAYTSMDKQDITGNGGANYTLSHAVANEQEIEVFVNNVRQEGGVGKAYTVSGTALTMTGNVSSSDEFYVVFQGKAVGTIVPPDGSVTNAKITAMAASKLTGALPALDGSALTGVGVSGISSSSTSGTAMSIDANNIVTMPARPMFHAYGNSGSWTIFSNSTWTKIAMNAEALDNGNNYDATNSKFVAPVAAVYHLYYKLYGRIQSGGGASTYWQSRFHKNNNGITGYGSQIMAYQYTVGGVDEITNYSMTISLAANDEITLHAQAAGSSNGEYYPLACEFGGHLIG